MKSLIFIFFTVFMISQSWAARPEIINTNDNISQGQILFINGSNFLNENTSDWHMTLAQSRCEGSSPVADGWTWQGNSVRGGYVDNVSLVGDKSLRFIMTGTGGTNCPYDNAGTAVYRSPSNPIVYARAYVRYSSNCEQLFDTAYYVKMFYWMQAGVYVQPKPESGWPTRMGIKIGGSSDYFNLPAQWTGDRWLCVEAKADNTNDEVTVWVDGQFVATYEGALSQNPSSFLLGFVNACPVPADTFYMFTDSATLSTSRIYPLTLVEIGNNSDYATATKVTQELIHAGENQLEIKCDLNELGAGPYYLWITNNRQERSNTYSIVGNNEEDTDPPLVSIATPTSGQTLSGTVTISANATDNVGVAGVQFKLDGSTLGTEDTTPPYSISWDTTTTDDGAHVLTATARDTAGNSTTSTSINITVNNSVGNTYTILFEESFEDTNFSASGWYDNINLQLSTTEHVAGSTSSVAFHFLQGATTPTSGGSIRKKFTETDEVYVSYYVKYSSNWEGSNRSYHPHEFMLLTNLDSDWSNLAYTHLTTYIEQNEGIPLLGIQDGQNIDESNINVNLTGDTEQRSVAGCNGDSDGYGNGTCYPSGSVHWNGKQWKANSVYFSDNSGQFYKNDWHFVEAYIKLNSIQNGKGVSDGVLRYWYDGNLIIDHNNVMMRTGQHPDMKFNQFVIAPWIGDGSPVDQTFWIDNLTIGTSRLLSISALSAPTDFRSN